MIVAVIDTNVLVSGMLSPYGAPGQVLDAIVDGFCSAAINDGILAEYEEVLARPKFGFPVHSIRHLLNSISICSTLAPFTPLINADTLPDPDDAVFLQAALSLDVPLVTGNLKHFPRRAAGSIPILSPTVFISEFRKSHNRL